MMLMSQQEEEESSTVGGASEYGAATGGGEGGVGEGAAAIAAATAVEQETLPPNWYVYTDSRGVFYYHNPQLNVTQWERPPGASVGSSAEAAAAAASSAVVGDEACTLDLSFAEEGVVAGGSEGTSSSSSSRGGGRAAAGRGGGGGDKAGTGGRSASSKKVSNGFLSLAASPADVRQKLQQQEQRAAEASTAGSSYFSRLPTDSTVATSRLQQDYSGEGDGGSAAAAGGKQRGGPEDLFWLLRCCGCVDLYTALQRLFAVTTDDVCGRLRLALLPCRRRDGGGSEGNRTSSQEGVAVAAAELLTRPDMYGPFWVATTLVILAFACSNFPLLLFPSAAAAAGAAADVRRLGQAAGAVYGCFLLPPLVVWLALLYFASKRGDAAADGPDATTAAARRERGESLEKSAPALEQLLCVQGYAFVPLCLCSSSLLLLQVLPVHVAVVAQWSVTVAAGIVATMFLVQQLKQLLRSQPFHIKVPCSLLLVGAALLLLLLLMRFAAVGQQQAAAGKLLQPPGGAGAVGAGGAGSRPAARADAEATAEGNGAGDRFSSTAGSNDNSVITSEEDAEQQQNKTVARKGQHPQFTEHKEDVPTETGNSEVASLVKREEANVAASALGSTADDRLPDSAYEEHLGQIGAKAAESAAAPAGAGPAPTEEEGD